MSQRELMSGAVLEPLWGNQANDKFHTAAFLLKRRRRRGGSCKSLRIASCQISPTVTFSIRCSCTHHKNPQIFYYDMVLLFTRVKWEETEKNQRNPFQWEVNSSVHPNKSHFMRISWELQQLNADTREEIYHQWLLFWFLNKNPFDIEARLVIGSYW